jgi:hypothetical protein
MRCQQNIGKPVGVLPLILPPCPNIIPGTNASPDGFLLSQEFLSKTEAFISTEKDKDFYSRCYTKSQERGEYYFEPNTAQPAVKPANPHTGKKGNRDWSSYRMFHPETVRRDFPALQQTVNGKPLVWLDNAATTHKPQSVIDALRTFL